jgi:hypothetical protein
VTGLRGRGGIALGEAACGELILVQPKDGLAICRQPEIPEIKVQVRCDQQPSSSPAAHVDGA